MFLADEFNVDTVEITQVTLLHRLRERMTEEAFGWVTFLSLITANNETISFMSAGRLFELRRRTSYCTLSGHAPFADKNEAVLTIVALSNA